MRGCLRRIYSTKQIPCVLQASRIKGFGTYATQPEIGKMSDGEMRDLIAGRYEQKAPR